MNWIKTRGGFATIAMGLVVVSERAWAQTCEISVGYASLAAAVPGLSIAGLGILAAIVGIAMWRKKKENTAVRMLSIGILAGAIGLGLMGGNSVVAAGPYEFNTPSGGLVADTVPYQNPAPLISISNTSGQPVRITANGNASEIGSCTVGAQIAAGASCTTQTSSCRLGRIDVISAPVVGCSAQTPADEIAAYRTDLDPFQVGVYSRVFRPAVTTPPVFSMPSVPLPGLTYTLVNTTPVRVGNVLSNFDSLRVVNYEVTVTAPVGYGFGAGLAPTMTWTGQTDSCWRQDVMNV